MNGILGSTLKAHSMVSGKLPVRLKLIIKGSTFVPSSATCIYYYLHAITSPYMVSCKPRGLELGTMIIFIIMILSVFAHEIRSFSRA